MTKLPIGYKLERDIDGDWVLIPPPTHTIFSEPGEGLLIGAREADLAQATAYALEELAK